MKKKIIFFVPDLSFGGAQRTFINLCNYFTQKKKLNYEVYLLVLNFDKNASNFVFESSTFVLSLTNLS